MKKMNIIIFSLFLFTRFAFAEYEIYMERGMVKVDKIVSSIKNENGLMTITIIDNSVTDVCHNVKYIKEVNPHGDNSCYSDGEGNIMNEIYVPFEDGIVLFLIFGLFFFGIMSNVAEKEKYKTLGVIMAVIFFIALPLYLVPELTYIVTAPADFFKGIAGGLLVLLCLPFGWIIIILIICALCSIFIK